MDLCDQRQIKALLTRHGFHFSKRLGQNFLIAPWVPQETAAASGAAKGIGVLEIGPGIGPLTQELSLRAEKVAAVELDRSLLPVLAETMAGRENVTIIPGDILKLDLETLCREEFPGLPVVVCANLPYNITSPIITAFLEAGCFETVTVMVQKEVAKRMAAKPGTADYGAFSVLVQWYTQPELLFDVPPHCFVPAPKVTSAVIRLQKRETPPAEVKDERLFFRTVRAAFNQRRKTLVNALASGFGEFPKEMLVNAIKDCGFDEKVRGETLSISDFSELTNVLAKHGGL